MGRGRVMGIHPEHFVYVIILYNVPTVAVKIYMIIWIEVITIQKG